MDRRAQDDLHNRHRAFIGSRTWRKFIHYLLETNVLYSAFADNLCNPKKVPFVITFSHRYFIEP